MTDPNAAQAAATSQEHWAHNWLKPDGSLDHTAFDKAPDEFKAFRKDVERYKTVDEYLKGQRERDALLGKKGIVDPLPSNATEAQKAERAALLRRVNGVPEKAEGYGLAKPQDLPDQFWNNEFASEVAKAMQEEAVSPSAAKRLFDLNLKYTQASIKAQQEAEKAWFANQDKLARDVAGKEGMSMEDAMKYAQLAGRKFGVAADNPILKNASALLALARVGRLLGETSLVQGDVNDFSLAANMAPEAAAKEATRIQTDKTHPLYAAYWNRDGKHSEEEVNKARETQQRYSRLGYANRSRTR